MFFIGIDPSTSSTGFAVLDEDRNLIHKGKISGSADDPKSFTNLYNQLTELLETYPAKAVYCETQFIGVNRATSIKLIRPTGVVLAVVGAYDVMFDFIAPASWRKHLHGQGSKWSKKDTYAHVKELYPGILGSFTKDNDISDAIGIATAALIMYQEAGEAVGETN